MKKIYCIFGAVLLSFATAAYAGQWSQYAACDTQYIKDSAVCRSVATQACWASASERLAYCNKTKGVVGAPVLRNK